ncbi:MAG: SRPBCC family protein [Verrucomicrobiales bacterium]|nr:SRPBCC family protein [Verrucomicrobiales bacterium]
MIKKLLLLLAVAVVALVVIAALQPAAFKVTRTATIAASPAKVFALLNDFHRWDEWSPWAKLDPAMKTTYEGPSAGVGAIYTWSGDSKVGKGRMTLAESKTNEVVGIKLEFLEPMAAVNATEFQLKPQGDQTTVIWSMDGTNNFAGKLFCLFMNMDKMVGGDFERGLAQLKTAAESKSK